MSLFSQRPNASLNRLVGWTIYAPTCSDYPGFYVARAWVTGYGIVGWPYLPPGREVELRGRVANAFVGCLYNSLEEARFDIGPEFTNIGRQFSDEPQIIEVWI